MCIGVFLWQAHPLYPFVLLNNRDEYHERPTKALSWWEDLDILGGRDEVGGGTWLGCSRQGRFAFLTNVLEPHNSLIVHAQTRGNLPLLFLKANELKREAGNYNGFNLIVGDVGSKCMYYITNRAKGGDEGISVSVEKVSPGLHVLSNASLDSPWHKCERLKQRFQQEMVRYGEGEIRVEDMIHRVMKDRVKADQARLPHICSLDWESHLSSIFVQVHTPLGVYGTRSTSALTVTSTGEVSFYELYLDTSNTWKEHLINFYIN
ncbi:transport and Golgi organization 2-like protein [Senna tora]|uniref:Transport and Golgi organization 2-like protein n=1 Tax=Senna tora TaxID=362788 RepID=A0A834SYJ5_9FABA|nr:transport and Golgi organization 2-like protein [Senna tora]